MKKKILILIALFLLCAGAWMTYTLYQKGKKSELIDYSSYTKNTVNEISIQKGNKKILLSKTPSQWEIDSLPLDEQKIERALASVTLFSKKKVISTKADKYSVFDVTSSNTLVCVRKEKGKELTFIIGKDGAVLGTTYIRFPDSADVYVVPDELRFTFRQEPLYWKNLKVVELEKNDITGLTLHSFNEYISILKTEDRKWKTHDKFQPISQETALEHFLLEVSYFIASDVFLNTEEALKKTGLVSPASTLTLSLSNKRFIQISISRPIGRNIFVLSSEKPGYIYKLPNSKLETLNDLKKQFTKNLNS